MNANVRHGVAKTTGIPILGKNSQIFHGVPFFGPPDDPNYIKIGTYLLNNIIYKLM